MSDIRTAPLPQARPQTGYLVEFLDESAPPLVFHSAWLVRRRLEPSSLFALRVTDQRMEPRLQRGDTVVIDTGDTFPRAGAAFAVAFEGVIVLGRLAHGDEGWWLTFDNPEAGRAPRKLRGPDLGIVGRAVWTGSDLS